MSFFGWLEGASGERKLQPDLAKYGTWGTGQFDKGVGIEGEGLERLRAMGKGYGDQLASGRVLPDSIYNAYSKLRGKVADDSVRASTGLGADIAQENSASGGRLSPEQQAELRMNGQEGINQQSFGANRDLGVSQAHDELGATNDLMNRLEGIQGQFLQAGQFRQGLGSNAYLQSLMARIGRNKAISESVTSSVSTYGGGR